MILTNIKRVTRAGFINFWRNGSVSLASVLIVTVALSIVGYLLLSKALLDSTLNQIKERVDINIYLTTGATEEEIVALQKKIEAMPEVSNVKYTSREEELELFKKRHEGSELTLRALEEIGENPLGASLNIKAKNPEQYEGIAEFLTSEKDKSESSIIDKFNYNRNKAAIDTLSKIIASSQKLGIVVVSVFAAIALLIIFNTIRLTIYMAREEISVMRLVGASPRYIKGPFVVEGIMYGLLGAFLTFALLFPVTYWAGPYTVALGTGINVFNYLLANMLLIAAVLAVTGFIIGGLSSYLAVKKYLKV